MPIINNPSPQTSSNEPVLPPLEKRQGQTKRQITNTANQQYKQLCQMQKFGIHSLWRNQNSLTPQEVCDAFGTEAKELFDMHGALTNLIVTIALANQVVPDVEWPTLNWTINSDGTVTILETAYQPPF